MIKRIQFLLCLFLLLPLALVYCQEDRGPFSKTIDSLYREDQFYFSVTYNLLSNKPTGVNLRGLTGGVHVGYLRDMPINKRRNIAIAVGAGLSFNTYGQNLFVGEDENNQTIFRVLEGNEVIYDRNRFSTYLVEAPVEFRWRSSSPETYKFWRVYAGFKAGYVYYYKTTFIQPNNEVFQTDIAEFNPFRMAATLSFGYNTVNFYAYYNLNSFFEDAETTNGQDVDLRTVKVGLIFYIL